VILPPLVFPDRNPLICCLIAQGEKAHLQQLLLAFLPNDNVLNLANGNATRAFEIRPNFF